MARSEDIATEYFYAYDYRLRGYLLEGTTVPIPPSFTPYRPPQVAYQGDDGKVPSLLSQIITWFSPKEEAPEAELFPNDEPLPPYTQGDRTVLVLSFPKGSEATPHLAESLLTLLSRTEEPVSFEIVATKRSLGIQFTCGVDEALQVRSAIAAVFPGMQTREGEQYDLPLSKTESPIALVDFGLSDECVRPILTTTSFAFDPLAPLITRMDNLGEGETAIFQVLFQGTQAPFAQSLVHAVSDGRGGSFFVDDPEMPKYAKDKVSSALFGVVIRLVVHTPSKWGTETLMRDLIQTVTVSFSSSVNELVPLSNEGYPYDEHVFNVFARASNRHGMLLNAQELATLAHYPSKTVFGKHLRISHRTTKEAPKVLREGAYHLGNNTHNGVTHPLYLSDEDRIRHCHIIGATGVGKSTLIAHLILEDIHAGNGVTVLDPHGDLIDEVLAHIPKERAKDVILVDPADTEYPIGFNLFEAGSDLEKIVLSSDLISAFQRQATSWGDVIHSILANAINTFLASDRGGTVIDLKRFLVDPGFRKNYLTSVRDPSLLSYWQHDYPALRRGSVPPLLIRLDAFLQSSIIRNMLSQKEGLHMPTILREKKILLLKLSQGLIGERNAALLGSLFLSKINQAAQGRQALAKEERHPHYLYLDEFHHFVTESLEQTLSGARKYGLGLTLVHQSLSQIKESSLEQAVLANPSIRICFRLGERDAGKLASDFSSFVASDFASLGIGEAIAKVGASSNDFSLDTVPPQKGKENKEVIREIITQTRERYAHRKEEEEEVENYEPIEEPQDEVITEVERASEETVATDETSDDFAAKEERYRKQRKKQEEQREHRVLQTKLKVVAENRGWKATIEQELASGGRVDLALSFGEVTVACEISVTNTAEYEVGNISKCLEAGFSLVYLISSDANHLEKIKERAQGDIGTAHMKRVLFLHPDTFLETLERHEPKSEVPEKRIKGYRVRVNYVPQENPATDVKQSLVEVMMKAIGKCND